MFALKSAQRLSRAVRIEWVDGLRADFTYVWLRDNSQRRPSLVHLELNTQPEAIDAVDNHLHVVWPPFLASDYSSEFLREHTKIKNSKDRKCTSATKVLAIPWRIQRKQSDILSGQRLHMATVEWRDTAVDPGSVWPHLERIPSVVEVESVTSLGRVHLVDAVSALTLMNRSHPELFRFLTDIPIPYAQGFFQTSHKIANIEDGRVIGAVFNNTIRSSEITTESVEIYYQSMKIFNEICCNLLQTIELQPDETLIVDNAQVLLGAPAQKDRRLRLKLFN
ncbi:hypothetical protein WR25_18916 [Diploscapter pachys]|uniref:Uncharacterized protein n=1 Tax=Diploscapter pachys TaxID=2018661 RepID=A0A2A2KHD6_9BILA|nr:hypothetical protein WR25_18916 [Diploscapter pachys]